MRSTVRNASSKQNGVQWRETCFLDGALPGTKSFKAIYLDIQYQENL
jgi:type IV secretory pathway TrbF-like protein